MCRLTNGSIKGSNLPTIGLPVINVDIGDDRWQSMVAIFKGKHLRASAEELELAGRQLASPGSVSQHAADPFALFDSECRVSVTGCQLRPPRRISLRVYFRQIKRVLLVVVVACRAKGS